MRTLTIHALEPAVEKRIRAKARREGKSINQALKELLATSVGVGPTQATDHKADFTEFLGIWTDADAKVFDKAIADLEKVDPADWE
jgi:hypothetical protein